MKKTKQLLIRVSEQEYQKIIMLSELENASISQIIRGLITYRFNYLAKHNKITNKSCNEVYSCKNDVVNDIDPNLLNELKNALFN